MGKPIQLRISNFSGGIADSARKPSINEFQITKMI